MIAFHMQNHINQILEQYVIINHICSNAYSQPKREGFVDKWRMFTWHQACA